MDKIPTLSALVPMRFPELMGHSRETVELGYGVLNEYEKYYYEHPRSLVSRFLAVLKELIHLPRRFWYVLELAKPSKNHFLALRFDPDRQKIFLEKLLVTVIRTKPEGNENVIETAFQTKTWKSESETEVFLDVVYNILLLHPPTLVMNFYENQLRAKYTPLEFLRRTRSLALRHDQFSRRVQEPKPQRKEEMTVKPSTRSAETNFDNLLQLHPWGISDWYECMGFSIPRRPRHVPARAQYFEPPSIYIKIKCKK